MTQPSPKESPGDASHKDSVLSTQRTLERSLQLLEFTKVRETLAQHTSQPLAAELARRLRPSFTLDQVRHRQTETAEAVALLQETHSLDLSAADDVRPLLQRAAKGGVLTGQDLLAIQRTMEAIRLARGTVLRVKGRAPTLRTLARNIPDLKALENRIRRALDTTGNVVDDATPYLKLVRQETRSHYQHLMEVLTEFAHSPTGRDALQDDFVTLRSERLVVPVKAELRHHVPGVVHDISDSGATLFIEPFFVVDRGNAWRELVAREEDEVLRILRGLSQEVGQRSQEIEVGMDLAARLDLALAKARYARAIGAASPRTTEGDQVYLRLVRGQVLYQRERQYVRAARAVGNSDVRIMFRHLLPNCLGPVIAQVPINVGWAILLTAGLGFLGVGVRVPTPEWGSMISVGARYIVSGQWWVAIFPGLAIGLVVLAFNLLGDALQQILHVEE